MSKQDYIMHKLKDKEINVNANPRGVKAIRGELQDICNIIKENKFDENDFKILKDILKMVG